MSQLQPPSLDPHRSRSLPAGLALALGVWILCLSLLPFESRWPELPQPEFEFAATEGWGQHVAAFCVFGALLGAAGRAGWRTVGWLVSGCLALELLQLVAPGRHPALLDLVFNAVAAVGGAYVGRRLRQTGLPRLVARAARWWQAVLVAGVLGVAGLLGAAQLGFDLSTWDPGHHLVVGNEAVGQRPWRGRLSLVAFYPEALSAASARALAEARVGLPEQPLRTRLGVATLYTFESGGRLVDCVGGAGPPALVALGESGVAMVPPALGAVDGADPLRATASAARLSRALSASPAFTVELGCAVDKLRQGGPARIVTLSRDAYERSFTVGQEGHGVVFRVGCAATGPSAARYEGHWRRVFRARQPVHLVLVYDRGIMTLYRNGEPYGAPYSVRAARAGEHIATGGGLWATALLWFVPLGIALRRGWPRRRGLLRIVGGAAVAVVPAMAAVAWVGVVADRPSAWLLGVLAVLGVAAGDVVGGLVQRAAPRRL